MALKLRYLGLKIPDDLAEVAEVSPSELQYRIPADEEHDDYRLILRPFVMSKTTVYSDSLEDNDEHGEDPRAWIVPRDGATGPWHGHEDEIALWRRDADEEWGWGFTSPEEYDAVFVVDEPVEWYCDFNLDEELDPVTDRVAGPYVYYEGMWVRFQKLQTITCFIHGGRDCHNALLTEGGAAAGLNHATVINAQSIGRETRRAWVITNEDPPEDEDEKDNVSVIDEAELFLQDTAAAEREEDEEAGDGARPALATTGGVASPFYCDVPLVSTFIEARLGDMGDYIKAAQTTEFIFKLSGGAVVPLLTTGGVVSHLTTDDVGLLCQVIVGGSGEVQAPETDWYTFEGEM